MRVGRLATACVVTLLATPPGPVYARAMRARSDSSSGRGTSAESHASASNALHATATILTADSAAVHEFVPRDALGAALDGHDEGETKRNFTPRNLEMMRGAGLGAVNYRSRTELANEAWHWNPAGQWSDSVQARGYWTSRDVPERSIDVSYGFRLPRRGNTRDQANFDGYSRLDDGDTLSFWKSNPYLDPRFTSEPDAEHVQWVVTDLGRERPLDAARIRWGQPYARRFRIQYWEGRDDKPCDLEREGRWRDFPGGASLVGESGTQDLRLAKSEVVTRYVRLLLEQSSHTAPRGSSDVRDSLGFAIRELELGTWSAPGRLEDVVRHERSADAQTRMLVSSTDPWHRAVDLDRDIEQPGLDLLFRSDITAGSPVMLPVGVLYDTPVNAAAMVRYVRARAYPVRRIELGEEPDGQYVAPEDYAALYVQAARALRQADSTLVLGGPSLQDAENGELGYWPERTSARHSWMGRFLEALERTGHVSDFQFFSFEWYPFAFPCEHNPEQVMRAPRMLRDAVSKLKRQDVSGDIPWLISEYGYSVHAASAEVRLEGALVNADLVGGFLTAGFQSLYLYGYEPGELMQEPGCTGQGNLMMLLADDEGQARHRLPAYYAAWLLTHAWTSEANRVHHVYPVSVVAEHQGDSLAAPSVYAVSRPDGRWGVLLINRDARRSWSVDLGVEAASATTSLQSGAAEMWQYSRAQYEWARPGVTAHPERNEPPVHRTFENVRSLALPPYSITVVLTHAD
jgi:hypothetical protein